MWAGAGRICTGNASALLELDCLVPPWFDKKASLFKLNKIRTNYTLLPEVVINCSLCTAHSIFFCLFCAFVFVSTCSLKSIFSKKEGAVTSIRATTSLASNIMRLLCICAYYRLHLENRLGGIGTSMGQPQVVVRGGTALSKKHYLCTCRLFTIYDANGKTYQGELVQAYGGI